MKNTLVKSSKTSILIKNTTSGHVESGVEDQDSEDHHSRGHRVIQVVEGDRLEGNLTDQKWPYLIKLTKEWTFTQAMKFPWRPTLMTRKTRKMLTRSMISPIQKNTEVTATDKIEAKTWDTGPQNIFIVISVPWTTIWLSGIYFHICDIFVIILRRIWKYLSKLLRD